MLIDEIRTKILPRRGVHARPDEVLITLGSQHAVSLALTLLADRKSLVAVEQPGYADVRAMARELGARLLLQPVDAAGLVVDARLAEADVIVVTPSHQYPTGVPLSLERREALLRLAAAGDTAIIEDDFECETTYFEPALPALRALPGGERVIYAASLSAGARTGAQARLHGRRRPHHRRGAPAAAAVDQRDPPLASQRTAAYFLSQGFYDKTMARTGRAFRERRLALREALNHYLQRWVAIDPAAGGTSFWVRGPDGIDVRDLAREAEQRGVLIEPVDVHFEDAAPINVFRLGVSGVPAERIRAGVEALAGLIREKFRPASTPRPRPWPAARRCGRPWPGPPCCARPSMARPAPSSLMADGRMIGRAGYANGGPRRGPLVGGGRGLASPVAQLGLWRSLRLPPADRGRPRAMAGRQGGGRRFRGLCPARIGPARRGSSGGHSFSDLALETVGECSEASSFAATVRGA